MISSLLPSARCVSVSSTRWIRWFGRETQRNYIRDVGRFESWLGRSPDTATAEEVRRFQVEQRDLGVSVPTANGGEKHPFGAAQGV
jgi:putative hemolysin